MSATDCPTSLSTPSVAGCSCQRRRRPITAGVRCCGAVRRALRRCEVRRAWTDGGSAPRPRCGAAARVGVAPRPRQRAVARKACCTATCGQACGWEHGSSWPDCEGVRRALRRCEGRRAWTDGGDASRPRCRGAARVGLRCCKCRSTETPTQRACPRPCQAGWRRHDTSSVP